MPPDPGPTRQKLIDAAARLFAARGIHSVSQAEIVKAAGARNNAALYYHFRNREGVLQAIIDRTLPAIGARRLELLAAAGDDAELPILVEAYVRPIAELLGRTWREAAYLQISADIISDPRRTGDEMTALLGDAGGPALVLAIRAHLTHLPEEVRSERLALAVNFVARAVADRARRKENRVHLDLEAFIANLIDMVTAALTAPVSVRGDHPAPVSGTRTRSRAR